MPINITKLLKEISKGDVNEQIEAYKAVKELVASSLLEAQKQAENTANDLQNQLDKLNNSN